MADGPPNEKVEKKASRSSVKSSGSKTGKKSLKEEDGAKKEESKEEDGVKKKASKVEDEEKKKDKDKDSIKSRDSVDSKGEKKGKKKTSKKEDGEDNKDDDKESIKSRDSVDSKGGGKGKKMKKSKKEDGEDNKDDDKESFKSRDSVDSKGGGKGKKKKKTSKKDDDKDSIKSRDSVDSKGKDKGLKKKRGSLKFGEDGEPIEKGGKRKADKPKETERRGQGFDPSKHQKPTVVIFHDNDDLMWGKGVGYKPSDAVPKAGPGITNELEKTYGPCLLLSEFKYTTWADTVVPLRNHNVVQGFNEMALVLIKLAANGGEDMSHEDAFLAVSFLSNIRNDLGEHPPNILALMEHIDYLTKGHPRFRQMDACNIDQWY